MRPRVVLVSRELAPLVGGGIAPSVRAIGEVLAAEAEVTFITTAKQRRRYEQLAAGGPVFGDHLRVVFAEEPEDEGHFYHFLQAWSHSVLRALLEAFPDRGPDLVEFPDYCAEGFVTIQAKRTGEPLLRDTVICVRTHTTQEMANVLNGHTGTDLPTRAVYEMERHCLRHADRLLWQGGDILGTYERFYGDGALSCAMEVTDAFRAPDVEVSPPDAEGPLRLLFLGRLERRKGVRDLVKALLASEADQWRLTTLGGDTDTAPLGVSMRTLLGHETALDDRIDLHPPVAPDEVGAMIAAHDAVVVPSVWECWPNVVREAYAHGRPVIATPVGGLVKLVRPGVSGWLAPSTGRDALVTLLEPLIRDPAQVRALGASDGLRQVLDDVTNPVRMREAYLSLVPGAPRPVPPRPRRPSLVSVVVPYHGMHAYVEDTVRSIAEQTYPAVECVIVNDGSFREEDSVLEAVAARYDSVLVHQRNRGLGAARNTGIEHAHGRYFLPLDADDTIEPDFVERAVHALERDADLAYVGAWSRYVDEDLRPFADPGYAPLGNWSRLTEEVNVAGSATALVRRHLFHSGLRYSEELTSFEDWLYFLQLRRAGHHGEIIPRTLLNYRVRASSMLRTTGVSRRERLHGEIAAHLAQGALEWTSPSA